MKEIKNIWTLVYKDKDQDTPLTFSYTSEPEAKKAKRLIEESNGEKLVDEHDNVVGHNEVEWCYLLSGKLIDGD